MTVLGAPPNHGGSHTNFFPSLRDAAEVGPLDRVAQGTLIKEAGHMENLQWFIRAHAENSLRMLNGSEDASHGSGNRADAKNF